MEEEVIIPTKPTKERKRTEHRDMPKDPRLLAKAMFSAADRKIEEGRAAAKKSAARGHQVRNLPSLPARTSAINYSL